jgi:hypothetical protein
MAEIEQENDEIRRLKDEITRNAASSTYFARMQLGPARGVGAGGGQQPVRASVHDALRPVAVASRSNKVIGDRMILNAAFLVERSREREFDEKVKEVSRRRKRAQLQVHRSVAAVQLREHQAQAGEGDVRD